MKGNWHISQRRGLARSLRKKYGGFVTGIRPGLTPLAAAGLVIIMVGATVVTLAGGDVALALIPLVVGLLSAFVAYGRFRT